MPAHQGDVFLEFVVDYDAYDGSDNASAYCAEQQCRFFFMGLVRDGFLVKAIEIGKDGWTIDDVLVHDAHASSNFLHQQLAMMDGHDLPLAVGVIRDVEAPTYNDGVSQQVEEVRARKGFTSLRDMILAGDTWTVE